MLKHWWKVLAVILLIYSFTSGLLGKVPELPIVRESIRNLYYHVPMWFAMMTMFTISFVNSILYLAKQQNNFDTRAATFANTGIFFGILGIITGMVWANFTWGAPWSNDPKQIGAALCILSYLAYYVLRSSIKDEEKKSKVAAVYNIFAFALMIPFLYIIPDLAGDSLHPATGGNVGFSDYDKLDNNMRKIFYPAIIGWILIGVWISQLHIKLTQIEKKLNNSL